MAEEMSAERKADQGGDKVGEEEEMDSSEVVGSGCVWFGPFSATRPPFLPLLLSHGSPFLFLKSAWFALGGSARNSVSLPVLPCPCSSSSSYLSFSLFCPLSISFAGRSSEIALIFSLLHLPTMEVSGCFG